MAPTCAAATLWLFTKLSNDRWRSPLLQSKHDKVVNIRPIGLPLKPLPSIHVNWVQSGGVRWGRSTTAECRWAYAVLGLRPRARGTALSRCFAMRSTIADFLK